MFHGAAWLGRISTWIGFPRSALPRPEKDAKSENRASNGEDQYRTSADTSDQGASAFPESLEGFARSKAESQLRPAGKLKDPTASSTGTRTIVT